MAGFPLSEVTCAWRNELFTLTGQWQVREAGWAEPSNQGEETRETRPMALALVGSALWSTGFSFGMTAVTGELIIFRRGLGAGSGGGLGDVPIGGG